MRGDGAGTKWRSDYATYAPGSLLLSMSIEGRHILEEVQGDFMRYVDARAIAQKARIKEIIPKDVEIQINESKSPDAAKNVLFKHLHDQVTLEGLRHFCSIMIESKGYQLMQEFGKGLLAKLEEVRWYCTNRFRLCLLMFNRQFSLANY